MKSDNPITLNRAKLELKAAREVHKRVSEVHKMTGEDVDKCERLVDSLTKNSPGK